ncbi:unnamed protein product [Agarophyton chilense]
MRDAYSKQYATVGKGTCSHELGRRASEMVREAREGVRRFIGAACQEQVALFPSTADAMRALAQSYSQILKRHDQVILADVGDDYCRTWNALSQRGSFRVVQVPDLSFSALAPLVSAKTKLFVLGSVSVFGNVNDLQSILEFLRATGIPIALNVSDSFHHGTLRVEQCGSDFVLADCTSAGVPMAFLYGEKRRLARLPPSFGGEHSLLDCSSTQRYQLESSNWGPVPERFEVGMSCLPRIASLKAVVDEYNETKLDAITPSTLERQGMYLYEQLRSCEKVQVYGSSERRALFACFNVQGVASSRVATALCEHGIYVKTGLHGAHQAHAKLGIKSSIRVHVDVRKHTTEDINHFIQCLKTVVRKLAK